MPQDRPYGLMPWHNTTLPECKRLNAVLRELDPKLFTIYDRRLQRYAVMGPSQSQGYAIIQWLEVNGKPVDPDVAPMLLLDQIARMDRRLNVGKLAEDVAAQMEKRWQAEREQMGEYAKYVWEAAVGELEGWQRHSTSDVMAGLRGAIEGRLKIPREQKGQRFSLPGRAV